MSVPSRLIFLTGFMGSGKSTVGRLLARDLGLAFIDLDAEIEQVEAAARLRGGGFRLVAVPHARHLRG